MKAVRKERDKSQQNYALIAAMAPMGIANAEIAYTRASIVKSPSRALLDRRSPMYVFKNPCNLLPACEDGPSVRLFKALRNICDPFRVPVVYGLLSD
jgi:hypothetical protein